MISMAVSKMQKTLFRLAIGLFIATPIVGTADDLSAPFESSELSPRVDTTSGEFVLDLTEVPRQGRTTISDPQIVMADYTTDVGSTSSNVLQASHSTSESIGYSDFFGDRPRLSPRVSVVPRGGVIAEIGVSHSDLIDKYYSDSFGVIPSTGNIGLRVGIADAPIELRLTSEFGRELFEYRYRGWRSTYLERHRNAAWSVTGGVKWQFLDGSQGEPAQAVLVELGVGDDDVAQETIWRAQWLLHWTLAHGYGFDVGLGGGNLTVFDDLEYGPILSAALSKQLGPASEVFLEAFSTVGDNVLQLALVGKVSDHVQLDIAAGARMITAEDFWYDEADGEFTGWFITGGVTLFLY